MSRPLGTKSNMRLVRKKEELVLEYLNGKVGYRRIAESHNISGKLFHDWIKAYQEKGIEGLKSKTGKKTGGTKGQGARKPKSKEEKLQREIIKLEIEVARLKKGYLVKGVGAKKEYVTTFDVNTK